MALDDDGGSDGAEVLEATNTKRAPTMAPSGLGPSLFEEFFH